MRFLFCLVLLVFWSASAARAADAPFLKLVQTISLPGVNGRIDHLALDAKGRRLFVAALGNDSVEVVDLASGKRLKRIAGLKKPTGVAYLPAADQLVVAAGEGGSLNWFSGKSYDLVHTLGSLDDADNIRLAAGFLFVGYGDGDLGVIDPAAAKIMASVHMAAHPEAFEPDSTGHRIFVNVPGANGVAVVNREQKAVVKQWSLGKFQGNYPMALDEAGQRVLIGCRQPPRLVALDVETGASLTDLEISGDADDLFFDHRRDRVYVSCGEGFLDVIQVNDRYHYERIAHVTTRLGARTCLYSDDLDQLWLAVPKNGSADAEIRVYQPE